MFTLARLRTVRYSTAASKVKAASGDKRYPLLKQILYSETSRPTTTRNLTLTPEQHSEHELIERMWCLQRERERDEIDGLLARQAWSMHNAALALEKVDKRLFDGACGLVESDKGVMIEKEFVETNDVVLFSPKLRIPTETLPTKTIE